jgi:folate-binding protein YgfZ
MTDSRYVEVPHRSQITVSGPDAYVFLQNIISNDLALLDSIAIVHACLLTPQGKFLHDFYVSRSDGATYHLECENGGRAGDLLRRLSLYKLRANISLELKQQHDVYIQIPDLTRSYTRPVNGTMADYASYDDLRIRHGLPEGSRDAEIGVSTLAELNLDTIAASYTKGCYVGQELVARMHNRNLGKKHLVPVEFLGDIPPNGTIIDNIGTMRSHCGNVGLILMSRETEQLLKEKPDTHDKIRLLGL